MVKRFAAPRVWELRGRKRELRLVNGLKEVLQSPDERKYGGLSFIPLRTTHGVATSGHAMEVMSDKTLAKENGDMVAHRHLEESGFKDLALHGSESHVTARTDREGLAELVRDWFDVIEMGEDPVRLI